MAGKGNGEGANAFARMKAASVGSLKKPDEDVVNSVSAETWAMLRSVGIELGEDEMTFIDTTVADAAKRVKKLRKPQR